MSATEQQTEPEASDPAADLRATPRPRTLERSFGLIAGILFIGGAFAGIPSSLLIDPAPPNSLYLITLAGVAFGLAAMAIPWDRISIRWAHLSMIVAIVQVALTVALAGDAFVFYFVFIAIFAAYAFSDRNQVAAYIGLIAVALVVPIIVIPDSTRATAAQALAAIPAIALVAVMVAFLRERLEDNRRTTRRFAREALALSARIGRLPVEPAPATDSSPQRTIGHAAWRRVAIGSSALLAVIAGLGTLAAAGVALPGPIERSFAKVGIEPSHGRPDPGRRGANGAQSGDVDDGQLDPPSVGHSDENSPGGPSGSTAVPSAEVPADEDSTPGDAPFSDAPPPNPVDGAPLDAPGSAGNPAATPPTQTPEGAGEPAPSPQLPPQSDESPKLPDIGEDLGHVIGNLLGGKPD